MRLHRFILRPLAPWATPLRSDTLYGLLLWRIAERQGDDACRDAIAAFREGEPPFALSSVLPEGQVFAPRMPPVPREQFRHWVKEKVFQDSAGAPLPLLAALQSFKAFRKLEYVPLSVWQQQSSSLSPRQLFAWFCSRPVQHAESACGVSVEPHVSIDRQSGGALEGGLYFNRLHWFRQDARLHLYTRTSRPEELLSLLEELGELGFGKDAALGKGRFAVQEDADFCADGLDNDGPDSLLLSVCASPDMAALQGWYATEIKRGKVWGLGNSPFKNPLLLLREGSLLQRLPQGPFVLQNIHPHARVVQITYPLTLPCRMAEEV